MKTFRVAMDIGGTFTDFVVVDEAAGSTYSGKVLTTPANPAEGVLAGLEQFIPELRGIEFLVHGTTVGLNSFLERKGTRVLLLMTAGLRDSYSIARHDRKELYALQYRKPKRLVARRDVLEVAERLRRQEAKAAEGLRAEARRLIRGVSGAAPSGGPAAPKLTPGMTVFVEGMGVRGTVEEVAGARVALRVRGKRVMVDREECRSETPPGPAPADRGPRLPPGVTLERRGDPPAGPEMQLRGLTVDEALARVDKYLDDAYLAGQSPVRLVHGVGTGRLQRAIAGLLARHPHVEGFGRAPEDEGGAGVTLVRLRL